MSRAVTSRYNPLLAQVVVTRRCNLSCGYCNEYDDYSPPVPLEALLARIDHLASLNTGAITFTGGEPLHPSLPQIIRAARGHGMVVTMITNGFRLSRAAIEALNEAGLMGMQISIDNLKPNEVSMKSLTSVERKLELLSPIRQVQGQREFGARDQRRAHQRRGDGGRNRRQVSLSTFGRPAARPYGCAQGVECGPDGGIPESHQDFTLAATSAELLAVPEEVDAWPAQRLEMSRRGARFLYICEEGKVHLCSQRRGYPGIPLLEYTREDIKREFNTQKLCSPTCTLSCVHQMSMFDRWRGPQTRSDPE